VKKKLAVIMAISLLPGATFAQQNDVENTKKNDEKNDSLQIESSDSGEDTILVRSTPTSQSMGTQILTAEQIERLPISNGNITELLKTNPNVRFSNDTGSSTTPGEIAPENVSFHGEKFYNNNFMIDGLSNNNTINPGANGGALNTNPDGYNAIDLPAGGTQSFWINSELVEQLEVFDSNISAKYGSFTGGVVDARLKDPDLERASGKVSYRTSRDSWTKYHIDATDEETFNLAAELTHQPKFKKNFYSFSANQPLSDKAGFIFAYNRQQSDIPNYHVWLGEWQDQKRIAETFMLKGTYLADNGDMIRLTGMHSPHESTYVKKDTKNGKFTNSGGGHRVNIEWEHNGSWGKMTSLAGYQFEENKIDHESDTHITWRRYQNSTGYVSDAINWGSGFPGTNFQNALIGGYGSFATEKRSYVLKQDYELNPFEFIGLQHQLDLGWEMNVYSARYNRFSNAYASRGVPTISSSIVCQTGDSFCIDGEQYFKSITLYPEREVSGNYNNYAVYLQDSMNFGRLEVTPGIRAQYDDYLENLTLAPRFAASYDVFGDRSTRVFGGANRYYGQSFLAYKLRSGISSNSILTRTDASAPWVVGELKTASYDYDISDLKTPYSDELSLGISQRVANTVLTAKWVQRDGRDQFGRKQSTDDLGNRYYVLDNEAHTKGNTLSLTVEPISPMHFSWTDISWSLGASYSENKSSSQTYYDQGNTNDSMVIFNGKLMEKGEMDALDFNSPWNAFATINTYFPAIRLNWGHFISYTAGYTGYTTASVSCPMDNSICGDYAGNATEYIETKYDNYLSYDWRFSYEQPLYKDQKLDVSLDVLNVFDNVIEASLSKSSLGQTVTYKTGRQFWLGVAYTW